MNPLKMNLKSGQAENKSAVTTQHFRAAVSSLIRHAKSEIELSHQICDAAVNLAGYAMAWIGFTPQIESEFETEKTILPICHAGVGGEFLEQVVNYSHINNLSEEPTAKAYRDHLPSYCPSFSGKENSQAWEKRSLELGFQSAVSLPLIVDEKVIGVFNLYSNKVNPLTEDDLFILFEVVKDLAFAISSLQLKGYKYQVMENLERKDKLLVARTKLIECTIKNTYESFLEKALDEISNTLESPIAFYHTVEPDQKTISLQGWSGRTVKEFCTAVGMGMHYPVDQAGVWADCIRHGIPIIHNDYPSLSHKKGLPEGHAPVLRQLIVPIYREEIIVGILGVGNKPNFYNEQDIEMLSYLADNLYVLYKKKQAESDFEKSREFNENLLKTIPFPMDIVDQNGRVLFASKSMQELLGRDPTGEVCWMAYKDNGHQCEKCPLIQVLESGGTKSIECTGALGGKTIEIFHSQILWEGKIAMLEIFQDITERKNVDVQLVQSDRLASIGLMAANVAHEINTPLGVMKLFLGQLKTEINEVPDFDRILDITNKMDKTTDRIAKTVKGMRMLSRDGSHDPKSLSSVSEIIEDVTSVLRERFRDQSSELRIKEISRDLVIDCRAVEIAQVILNLIGNSYDAIEGLAEKWVEVDAHKNGNSIEIIITDSGSGIPKNIADKIFDPFFTTKEVGKGTGIGLSISSKIIQAHGGTLRVNHEVANTQFVMSLPAAKEKP